MNIGTKKYIINLMNSITRFHELRDYKYWTYKIYLKFKKLNHFNKFNHAVP